MLKRLLSVTLAFLLVLSGLPVMAVRAAEPEDSTAAAETVAVANDPVEDITGLTEETTPSAEETEAPAGETEASAVETEAPTETATVPAEETEAPTEEAAAPTEATEEPETPTEETEAPTEETEPAEQDTTDPTEETTVDTISEEAALESSDTEISQEDFVSELAAAGSYRYNLQKSLTLTSDLTISLGQRVSISETGSITIPEGKTLTLNGSLDIYGQILIESGGTLVLNFYRGCTIFSGGSLTAAEGAVLALTSSSITVDGGVLTVEEGATLKANDSSASYYVCNVFGGSVISGVPGSLIHGSATPESFEALQEALRNGKDYVSLNVSLESDMFLTEDTEIPANASVSVNGCRITVSGGVSVKNYGSVSVRGESELWIQTGSTFSNQGSLTVTAPAVLTGAERVTGRTVQYEGYTTQKKFENAYAAALGSYTLEDGFTLTSDLTLDGVQLTLDSGGCITVPAGLTLTVDTPVTISGGSITVEADGKLVITDGTELTFRSGTLTVAEEGIFQAGDGSIYYDKSYGDTGLSGVPRESVRVTVYASNFARLKALLEDCGGYAEYEIDGYTVTLEEDVTVPDNVILAVDCLTIPAGKTLTNQGSIHVDRSEGLVIEEDGVLDNQGTILVSANGSVSGSVTGNEVTYEQPEPEEPDDGTTTMTQNAFEKAVLTSDNQYVLTKSVTYTADSVLGRSVRIGNGGSVTIPAGVTLQLTGPICIDEGGSLTIEQGGAVRVDDGAFYVQGGTLTVEDGGTLSMDVPSVYFSGGELKGVPDGVVQATSTVMDCGELEAAMQAGKGYYSHEISLGAEMVIDRDLTVPENVVLSYTKSNYAFTFQTGTVLTNNGEIEIYNGVIQDGAEVVNNGTISLSGTLDIEEGGILRNPGTIFLVYSSTINGSVEGNPPSDNSGSTEITVTTFAELKAAMEAWDGYPVHVTGTIAMEEDLSTPSDFVVGFLTIEADGELIIPNGITLTIAEPITVKGKLRVESGGSLVNNGYIDISGTSGKLEVADGGKYTAGSNGGLYGDADQITGIDKSVITKCAEVSTEEELRAVLDDSGYRGMVIRTEDDIVLTADLTIPAGAFYISGTIMVPSGVTLTVEGSLSGVELIIESGGSLVTRDGGYIEVSSDDDLVILDGAVLDIEPGGIYLDTNGYGNSLSGIPANLVYAKCYVGSIEQWKALIAVSEQYYHIEVMLTSDLAVAEDMTIPDNMTLALGYRTLTILEDVNLTNAGVINVGEDATLLVQSGATLTNNGEIHTTGNGQLIVNGELVESGAIPMYRLYNPFTQEHLFSSSEEERKQLLHLGWTLDGLAWYAPTSGTPVYRLYNPFDDWHTYSISQEEIDSLTPLGWKVDGIVCYSASEKTGEPIYRLFNPYEETNYHLCTMDAEERDGLAALGWVLEGIAWYGLP